MPTDDLELIITKNEIEYASFTIRVDRRIRDEYNKLAGKANRSRNELIELSLKFALEHIKFVDIEKKK